MTDKPAIIIPESPDESEVKALLARLEPTVEMRNVHINKEECLRLQGTPGEPIPRYELTAFLVNRFDDIDHVARRNSVLKRL